MEGNECLLTGLQIENFNHDFEKDIYEYDLKKGLYIYHFKIHGQESNALSYKKFYEKYELEINWMLLNNTWLEPDQFVSLANIEKLISEIHFPSSPKEKLDSLFSYIFKMQQYEGHLLQLHYNNVNKKLSEIFYMKNSEELDFYLKYLLEENLIHSRSLNSLDVPNHFTITFKGLEYAIKLTEEGQLSKNCFIAMSFSEAEKPIYTEGILPA